MVKSYVETPDYKEIESRMKRKRFNQALNRAIVYYLMGDRIGGNTGIVATIGENGTPGIRLSAKGSSFDLTIRWSQSMSQVVSEVIDDSGETITSRYEVSRHDSEGIRQSLGHFINALMIEQED